MTPTRDDDWATRSRGILDLATAAAGAFLVVLGLAMCFHDYARELDSAAAFRAFGATTRLDPTYRLAYVPYILACVVFLSVATTWRWIRVRQSYRLRRHGARFATMLIGGSALLDLAYYADTVFGLTAPHAVRAFLIDPLYALAGVIIAGSAWRLRTLIRPLPPGDPGEIP